MKYKGLTLLHNIGTANHSNYHTLEMVKNSTQPLGFDGIYYNVYENQKILEGKTGIFFVMGNYVGKDNTFDLLNVPKLEKYCNWEEVEEMCDKYDFEMGWHTYSHPDLTTLTKEEILKEIKPPKLMKYFAYPYGKFNDLAVECVKEVGFEYAWSVTQGCTNEADPDCKFKIYRNYL